MKPYYEHAGITIYHGDCREILPCLGPVDLVLTDPPYGLGDRWNGGGGGKKSSWRFDPQEAKKWDGSTVGIVLTLPSIAKECIIWGGNYYALPPSRCWLVWDKKQPDNWTTGQCELAWTSIDRPVRAFRMCQAEAHLAMNNKEHPTEKPLALMRWCLKWPNNTEAAIVDPFMGSGTTLVAAKQLGRRAIGIEIEERYCEIAAKRLAQEMLPLVAEAEPEPEQEALFVEAEC